VNDTMHEIGFYTLAGQVDHPRDLIAEVQHAERLGIGECFFSERFSTKEAAKNCGALGRQVRRSASRLPRPITTPAIPS
jgi:hypothetical protein